MPEERRMTITSSPHLAPDDVARHTFASVRRGFDPGEVRDYLESIADGLRGLAEREREILQELAASEVRAANPVLDEPTLTEALGKETARVLHSAHEVAAEVLANAEAEAQRLLGEATDTAEQARSRADTLVSDRSAEVEEAVRVLRERTDLQVATALDKARDEAELMAERAREECRAMVEEAQQLRARVLADLSRRRRVLHAQIEQLRAGRERLAQTVQDVRTSVESIADELFNAENDARLAAEAAGREAAERPDEGTPEELAAILVAEETEAAAALGEVPDATEHGDGPPVVGSPTDEGTGPETAAATEPGDVAAPGAASTAEAAPPVEEVDALFAKIRAAHAQPVPSEPAVAEPDPEGDPSETGEIPSAVTPEGEADEGPPADRHPMAVRRDEMLRPIVTALGRRLKRTLQDYQNDLLDALRSRGATWSSDLLPPEGEHLDRFATSALPALEQAAEAGVAFAATGSDDRPSGDALVGIADQLAEALAGPLRRRLLEEDGLDGAEESVAVEHIGSAFREWKGERVEGLAADHVLAAFSLGTIAAATGGSGAEIEWIAVPPPGETPCPDCEDNGLNGPQQAGEPFPTGNPHPPAHPGCRCLLVPASI